MTDPPPRTSSRRDRLAWLLLAIGLAWTAALRAPLILHARDHIDSDLAVDGITLIDAVEGRWRWHYPGTPHIGIPPVLLSYPQAMIWGPGPIALVAGGTVAWLLVVAATFALARRAFGPGVAAWSLAPLVFSSVGTVWLSGRITGGHLLTLAWHTAALLGLVSIAARGGAVRAMLLGLWCGLGLYLDAMFLFTLLGMAPAAVVSWRSGGWSQAGLATAMAFAVGLAVGAAPGEIGRRVDPYDPYGEQFAPIFRPDVIAEHARILGLECLPRQISGYELPELRATPEALTPNGRPARLLERSGLPAPLAGIVSALTLGLFAASLARLQVEVRRGGGGGRLAAIASLASAGLIVSAFLINRNIFNSDNYRYLIYLLVPWSLGFGLLAESLSRRGIAGRLLAAGLAIGLAVASTGSVLAWYDGLGWLGVGPEDQPNGTATVTAIAQVPGSSSARRVEIPLPPGASHLYGDYWDVYRAAFLSGGRVVGVPFPTYPNRFEGWSSGLGPGRGALLVLDPTGDWRAMLAESWRREGRDPGELHQLSILFP
ncbi:hypothetical protein [Tautonia sociabilis]|uniref:Glycosyltransferase RgtA/B/C/D-like domain-containing protein n=1 Tax=Tautonia sociabilis TaxID=2080755 RepID=A0A432MFN7_9BACT|nr:hypothetical protein [Tautonia sociabilis]RUL85037.1 hypothetical protein TsocGM_19030 [Tautonia sociabilis]